MRIDATQEKSDSAIFVFTRDRSQYLEESSQVLMESGWPVYIVDDSTNAANRATAAALCKARGFIYLGFNQYRDFIDRISLPEDGLEFLLREPGHPEWNLGFMRNWALLYACSQDYLRILYLDDDIEIKDLDLIDELFERLERTPFVGARVIGHLDLSIIGYVAAAVGVANPQLLSGGCLAFRRSAASTFFFNTYNEDWIWLLLHVGRMEYAECGTVIHRGRDPFDRFQQKILFQEYGELIIDGLLECYSEPSLALLRSPEFWHRILQERDVYLDDLRTRSKEAGESRCLDVLSFLLSHRPKVSARHLADVFDKYQAHQEIFSRLIKSG